MRVNLPHPGRSQLVCGVFSCLFICALGSLAQDRIIRLRNETIATPPKSAAALQPLAVESPATGLFLVQFIDRVQPVWREQLREMRVELIRYVPEDAFIARFDGASTSQVKRMSFVRWVGPYRPEHKVDSRLKKSGVSRVRVLLSPVASAKDRAVVRRALRTIAHETKLRFGDILQGEVTPGQLAALASSDAVLWIEPAPRPKLLDEVASKIVGGADGANGTRTVTQQLGFDGSDVKVAVADTGLNNGDPATMHPDLAGRVDAFLQYGSLTDARDEHSHGTHVAGIIAGNAATGETDESGALYGLGVASGAHLVVQRIFDGAGNFEAPPSNEALTRDAVRVGAVIGSNSWGDDVQGRYDLSAAEFDELVRDADAGSPGDQPYILEFSAGNAGPGAQTIDSPAVGKNVIATGASENDRPDFFIYADGQNALADFSSRGPCEDGRIKPDVVAPGTWIASLQSASATDENAWLPIDNYYQYQGGTSQAGPHASGAAAVFVQYYRKSHGNATPSPALVKAALINSAVDIGGDNFGPDPAPNQDEGWGRIDLTQIIGSTRRVEFIDQTNLLANGQIYEQRAVVASSDQPLKVTLAYTDVPGFAGAIPALVNDLDLEVVAPDGRIYRGNQFAGGESVPNAPASDNINNVEGVYLSVPQPGEYFVRVLARNVVEDARRDTPGVNQDFALVVSGDLPLPGVGVLFFDRGAYRAPDVIRAKLIDPDLAGQPSVTIEITSSTESGGEPLLLTASGPLGVFTNNIAVVTGGPVADGRLQVANGDAIAASYQDASPASARTATARADLVPPVLTNVSVTNRFGKMVVSWNSDEPATTIVRYGTNALLSFAATNGILEQAHQLELVNLSAGTTYQFLVVSVDEAGNVATNDNSGSLFSFVAMPAKALLLVDAYAHRPDDESTEIPVTVYTDALDRTGVSYEVWNVSQMGHSPGTNDLRPFKIVMWRVNDSFYDNTSLEPADQNTIRDYLNHGGAFFMSSMEILSRLGDVPFRKDVLQVQEFRANPDPLGGPCTDCDEDHGVPSITGVDSDPVTSGLAVTLDYSAYPVLALEPIAPDIGPDVADTFGPTTNASSILMEPTSGRGAGIRFPRTGRDSPGRVVFLSFPLDAVPETGDAPNNRAALLRNILSFLAPGVNGLGTIALDNTAYTIPALVTVEVGDSDLAGQGQTSVTFRGNAMTNSQTVTLSETVERGLFRGFITLIAETNPPAPGGQLVTRNGDTISAEYFDASAGSVIRVAARVDTVAPTIANIVTTPDYEGAEVSWDTSEAADSLVQFGESPLLGRTAYSADLEASHSLTLSGLRPDRIYYYQVVSRDIAGNTAVDDNNHMLYTLRTLKPLTPPWSDDLDNSGTSSNWTTFDGDSSEASWRLGVPKNGWETAAHSPPNAWGSNLNGDAIGYAESFLVSPAIDLSGGNVATLRFWQSYDFSGQNLEGGELLLVTNNATATLASYGSLANASDDATSWTKEEFDLTPYLGHVIYLAWHYVYFSLDFLQPSPRPGWLVDDVSVTVSNAVRATIAITNNIAQAQFTLSGPKSQAGQGLSLTLTNVPLGLYVVAWSAVADYNTPAPLTNLLASPAPLVFEGNYSFTDANSNGISDAWEQQFFGAVSTNRTQTTDTDADGTTDYAEFIAGTDPNSPSSVLELAPPKPQPNGSLTFNWPSVPGRAYRLAASTDLVNWTPVSDWISATTTASSVVLVPPTNSANYFYRLEVRP